MPHEGSPRWKFRKEKKLERRKKKRQEIAEQKERPVIVEKEPKDYQQKKNIWEANEVKHKIIETARMKAKQKEDEARKIAQKKWQETLLSLPLTPRKFTLNKKESTLKTFIPTEQPKRKTYRERFLEQKAMNNT